MVGGLVTGALEKLYRQPSLLACARRARREAAALPRNRGHKKRRCPYAVTSLGRLHCQELTF